MQLKSLDVRKLVEQVEAQTGITNVNAVAKKNKTDSQIFNASAIAGGIIGFAAAVAGVAKIVL